MTGKIKIPFLFGLLLLEACESANQIKLQVETTKYCSSYKDIYDPKGPLHDEPMPAPDSNGDRIVWLNPTRIRKLLVQGNASLIVEALRVHSAKTSVNQARDSLFPAISLKPLTQSLASPSFFISSVEYLLPFLVPTNWTNYVQQKSLYHAEAIGFLIAELNAFASAYATYQTIQMNYVGRDFLAEDLQDAIELKRLTEETVTAGIASPGDLDAAIANVEQAEANLNAIQINNVNALSTFRQSLGLCLDVKIGIESHHLPPSPLEYASLTEAGELVKKRAPEVLQLEDLIKASNIGYWGTVFSFITDASLSNPSGTGSSGANGVVSGQNSGANFSITKKSQLSGSLTWGPYWFDDIKLARDNIRQINAQYKTVALAIEGTLKSNFDTLDSIQREIKDYSDEEIRRARTVSDDKKGYRDNGMPTLQTIVNDQILLRGAQLGKVQAMSDYDVDRVTLHRLLRTEEFEKISGCWTNLQVGDGKFEGPCDEVSIKRILGVK